MAELKRRTRWKKWAPDIGENRELEGGPVLFLELAVDLTPAQLSQASELARGSAEGEAKTMDEVRGKIRKAYTEALTPFVRVHAGPHTVDGRQLATLEDYVTLVTEPVNLGIEQLRDVMAALAAFNSISGADELFSLRRSGGARSTDAQSTEKAASPTEGR